MSFEQMYEIISSMEEIDIRENAIKLLQIFKPDSRIECLVLTCLREGRIAKKEKNSGQLIHLLWHISLCDNKHCSFPLCDALKRSVQHVKDCRNDDRGLCEECLSVISVFCLHIDGCKNKNCPIEFCKEVTTKHLLTL